MEFSQKTSGGAHAGSTILTLNLNGDTLTDALLGDVFTNLVAAYNGGRSDVLSLGFKTPSIHQTYQQILNTFLPHFMKMLILMVLKI